MADKKLIFLVHGIGDHPKDSWSDTYVEQIKQLWSYYPTLSTIFEFEKQFEVVPIGYDDIFEDLRQRWKERHDEIIGFMESGNYSGKRIPDSVINYMTKSFELGTEDDFLRTHVLDVLLYYFTDLIREPVTLRVAKEILKNLSGNKFATNNGWNIIAHSMGTSVIHDALHSLYHGGFKDPSTREPLELTTDHTRINTLCMVANVSRLLERKDRHGVNNNYQVLKSKVKPSSNRGDGICSKYIDCRHFLDPIPMPRPFPGSQDWPAKDVELQEMVTYIELKKIAQLNVHSLEHYLADPDFHVPLFRSLTHSRMISEDEFDEARKEYHRKVIRENISQIYTKLEEAGLASDATWLQIIKSMITVLRGQNES